MADFEADHLKANVECAQMIFAGIVLPNHYHLLVDCSDILALLKLHGLLHSRSFDGMGKMVGEVDRSGIDRLRRP